MLILSPVLGEMRGSMGGTTASRNRYGQYLRQRSVPVNPNSARQLTVRGVWQALAFTWTNILTQVQRDAWDLYGENVDWLNKLGQVIKLTGYAHFQRSNGAIAAASGATVSAGPTNFTLPGADITFAATISEATQLISVVFDNTLPWANQDAGHMLVHMAQPRSASRLFIGGPTRTAGKIDGNLAVPPTSPQTIAVPFAVAATQNTEVLARLIEDDGRVSTLFRSFVTVAA